ncbi:MAG: ABC transporter substrate-binding protein [Christensenellaceae bacterium]|jgi:NitT/TauT family transport system substrate-binding protein|nr:ABC transporter substrate-binding protein [Christensenellaceae bacterium]
MKKITVLLLCGLLLVAAAACTQKSDLRQVTLNEVTRSVFYAPLYVAVTNGYFAEEGLSVEIVTGGGSDNSMTALLSGEAEVGLMGPETGVYVVNQGKQEHPMVVAQLTKRDGCFLLGHEARAGFDWNELRGKSIIAGRPGGMPYMTLLYVLRQKGLEPNVDVEIISNIQFNLMGGAFEGGTGDYVTLFEPTASQFELAGKAYKLANMGLSSGEVPYTCILMRPETIKDDPAFVTAFVRALYKAQKWVQTASDEAVAAAMQPFFPDTDIATLAAVAQSYRATDSWAQQPTMTAESFTRLQDIMEGAGELAARVELDTLVDNSFGEAVMAELG